MKKINMTISNNGTRMTYRSQERLSTVKKAVCSMRAAGHSEKDIQKAVKAYWASVEA